jgi:hypothetical protein
MAFSRGSEDHLADAGKRPGAGTVTSRRGAGHAVESSAGRWGQSESAAVCSEFAAGVRADWEWDETVAGE